jgi:Methylase involved in ubiquinone/menaquinone biosynthesis
MRNPDIDDGRSFDWGRTSADYAKYRDIYPPALYERLAALGVGVRGQKVLDLGTGTGVIPRNMYHRGAHFTGIDISEAQVEAARRLAVERGMNIDFQACAAEDMSFPADTFDAATAGQCFIYFDTQRLLPVLAAVLKRNGLLAIVSMNWLPGESPIAAESERIILKHNPRWTGGNMQRFPAVQPAWADFSGFSFVHGEAFCIGLEFTREAWHGRMRACRGVGASLVGDSLAAFEEEHRAMLQCGAPERFTIPHYPTILLLENRKGG